MFRVGQKVVCVDDEIGKYMPPGVFYVPGLDGLAAGEIYTVAELYITQFDGRECIRLVEIDRSTNFDPRGYVAARFRPVQETGMQMLRALLKTNPIKEVA